jgi:hypothetical protein
MTPPSKAILVQKLEQYLKPYNISSGIDPARQNYPDKQWLVLIISTLSQGKDEIFEPNYVPQKELFGAKPS